MRAAPSTSQVGSFPTHAEPITPSDTTRYAGGVMVYANGDGDVAVEPLAGGAPVVFTLVGGDMVPVRVRRVLATNTTATGLVGIY